MAYLGLDIGATNSRWVLLDDAQGVLSGAVERSPQDGMEPDSLASRLRSALAGFRVNAARARPTLAVAGVAGAGEAVVRAELERACSDTMAVRVVGDPEIAAAAALPTGPGIALWSGTGSFGVARDQHGGLHRVGGRGPLLGDEGSAYDLVRRAGVAAVAAADGWGERTELGGCLSDYFGASRVEGLGSAMASHTRAQLAGAFSVVVSAAADGDAVARGILDDGARRLVRLAVVLADRMRVAPAHVDVALGGGVLTSAAAFASRVMAAVRSAGFAAAAVAADDAALGAARLARAVDRDLRPLSRWVSRGSA